MFVLSKQEVLDTLKNYEKIMKRVKEVVTEIGFLNGEYDTLETDKTDFNEDEVFVVAYDSHYDLYDSIGGSFPLSFLFEEADKHKDWFKIKRENEQRKKNKENNSEQENVSYKNCNG